MVTLKKNHNHKEERTSRFNPFMIGNIESEIVNASTKRKRRLRIRKEENEKL